MMSSRLFKKKQIYFYGFTSAFQKHVLSKKRETKKRKNSSSIVVLRIKQNLSLFIDCNTMSTTIDLTDSPDLKQPAAKKARTSEPSTKSSSSSSSTSSSAKARKPAKKSTAHALLWICAAGKGGQNGRGWKSKSLKVIGVYASKDAAQAKKDAIMSVHQCCGNGDILVGDSWEDEIDLVVRAVEEVDPNL